MNNLNNNCNIPGEGDQLEISPSLDMESCPTGVLIDFAFGNNTEPEISIPQEASSTSTTKDIPEYEDTFDLFNHHEHEETPPAPPGGQDEQTTPSLPAPRPKSRTKTVAKGKSHWTHCQPPPLIPPPIPTEDSEAGPDSSLNSTSSPFGLGLGLESRKKARVKAVIKGVPQKGNICTPLNATKLMEKRVVDPFSPLFNTSTTGESKVIGPKNMDTLNPKRNQTQDPPTAELVICSENEWSFSPPTQAQAQEEQKRPQTLPDSSTPVKRPSLGTVNLSDSDSLLDISNLSGFSCSDSEGLLEELVDKLKLPDDDLVQDGGARGDYLELERTTGAKNKSPPHEEVDRSTTTSSQDPLVATNKKKDDQDQQILAITAVVNANRRNCDKITESEVESKDYVIREKKRRDSVNSKLQRFSMLMSSQSSPIRSPLTSPTSNPNNENSEMGNYFPTPSTSITTPVSRRPQSFHSWTPRSSVSTMTSPARQARPDPGPPSTPKAQSPLVAQQSAKKMPPPSPIQTSFMTPARRPQSAKSFHSWTPNRSSLSRTTPSRSGLTPLIPKAQAQSVKKIPLTFQASPAPERPKSKENRPNIIQYGKTTVPVEAASAAAPGGTKNKENHTKPKIMPSALPRFGFGYKNK